MATCRIVLLGKTGDGKSSSGNLILGEEKFLTGSSPNSITQECDSKTNSIHGKKISVVDTPGFFDTDLSSEKLKSEMLQCIIKCAPGPHAFVITLKVGRYTKQEMEIVKGITNTFGEEALKYAVVLFTFGDQLSKNETIEDFVKKSTELQDLVNKCGGRVHVIDNKYWNEQQDGYRSNSVQLEKLLNTIKKMVKDNGGKCYTNEMLQTVNKDIDTESNAFCEASKQIPDKNMMREQAKQRVHTKLSVRLVGVGTGALLGAFLGIVGSGIIVISALREVVEAVDVAAAVSAVGAGSVAAAGSAVGAGSVAGAGSAVEIASAGGALCAAGPWIAAGTAIALGVGAVTGGITGYHAVEGVDNVCDAMKMVAKETKESAQNVAEKTEQFFSKMKFTNNNK